VAVQVTQRTDLALDLEKVLRRAATLVAQGTDPGDLFTAVADQVMSMLGLATLAVTTVDSKTNAWETVFTHGDGDDVPGGELADSHPLAQLVTATYRPSRINLGDQKSTTWGPAASRGPSVGVASPLIIDGSLWGCIAGYGRLGEDVPPEAEVVLAEFANLMAISISNAQRREQVRDLARSQDALRRVATLVANEADPQVVFAAVAKETAALLGVEAVSLIRYDAETKSWVKIFATHGIRAATPFGVSWPFHDCPEGDLVLRSGRPGRVDDWSELPGEVAARHRDRGFGQAVAAPIILDGTHLGHIAAYGEANEVLPAGCEVRLADFTQLVASAISNTRARDDLQRLAQQGAALKRVATLVAQRADEKRIFDAVAEEASRAFRVLRVDVCRSSEDGSGSVLGSTEQQEPGVVPTLPTRGQYVMTTVLTGARADRCDVWDDAARPELAIESERFNSVAGAPIWVEGQIWGVIVALSETVLASDVETRLGDFADLVSGSIANVQARNELIASRARIVAASDEARRRIERNLHDGIQQRVVSLGLSLRAVRSRFSSPADVQLGLDEVGRELATVLEEIQIFSQGLHPALLSRSGLGPSLRALARRSPIPIELDIAAERLPESVETAVYYVVSEALANATKHSAATVVCISVRCGDGVVRAVVTDDGVGGATRRRGGSGLIGLVDRVETLGGTFALTSPRDQGTTVAIELPIYPPDAAAKLST
jgi:signal transduction histidine kinase